jgi:hypothetical protein
VPDPVADPTAGAEAASAAWVVAKLNEPHNPRTHAAVRQ